MLGQSVAPDVPSAVRTAAAKAAAMATPRASLEANPGIVRSPATPPRGGFHVGGSVVHVNPASTRDSMTGLLYLLFFCSGLSGLIYQVVWVRVFGNVFGNTVYSTSLVVAVFMLGLGVGGYLVGGWADRRYAAQPESLLRAYGYVELLIGVFGFGISALLPRLGDIAALASSYSRDADGWYVLSTTSSLARVAIAVVLLTPITMLMGGTLTLLIRHLVRSDLEIGSRQIAVLYAANTAGAALGCFLTD